MTFKHLRGCYFLLIIPVLSFALFFVGVLATAGVEIQSFSAPADRTGDLWYCVGVSSLPGDLSVLKPLVKEVAQLSI